ncbi:carbohydrate ABC transporter permease [Paenibacillus sp. J2TS4]|uniref:carbohydrate ABC transporter permease n=1 Tax=Paenibacillus sp. J2TS4 TaxID=2807194 RepID=UPI001B1B6381|nr:carbohydrate ABC transporter permease [Paenibacillus sp. J2TS4]GIP33229.1 sugar ABC transporter permease [Paenibacillus sp. J2TS4]
MTARLIWKPTRIVLAIIVTLIMFFPLYWLLITSVKSPSELSLAVPTFWPKKFAWNNYQDIFYTAPFARYALNTLIQTVGLVMLQLNLGLFAAYAFAKGQFWGRDKWFILVLAALMVPEQVTFVPVYVMMSNLGWLNTFLALIVPHGVSAYSIFLMRQAFKSINNDVLEAAKVDGAGRFRIIYRILVPMALPTVITIIILKVIGSWNSYFWPLIMTNSDNMRVLTVGIAMLKDSFPGQEMLSLHLVMAASVVAITPIVLLFIFAQKHIVSAMANSTFK